MTDKRKDFVIGVVFLVLCGIYFALSFTIHSRVELLIDASFMPRVYSVIGALLSVCLMWDAAHRPADEGTAGGTSRSEYRRVLLSFLLLTGYVMLLKPVGFLVCTAVYLLGQMMVMAPVKERRPRLFAGIACICSVVIFLVFRRGFHIMLPVGILKWLQ